MASWGEVSLLFRSAVETEQLIQKATRSLSSLAPTLIGLGACADLLEEGRQAECRGYFLPDEDERLRERFARYLYVRAGLLELLQELQPLEQSRSEPVDATHQFHALVIGYTAACLLVHAAKWLIDSCDGMTLVQRKLNEGDPSSGIPAKQYTIIYKTLTNPANAWQLRQMMSWADSQRREINALAGNPEFADIVHYLGESEDSLRIGVRRYLKARLRYRWHAWKRRRASAAQQALFAVMELGGRMIADLHDPWHTKAVNSQILKQTSALLQPGDVLVSRHHDAVSNLFLPGYWPHSALYIGDAISQPQYDIRIDQERASRWTNRIRFLEAKKDGVQLRPLSETLDVDAFVVLRPQLTSQEIGEAISRALTHEGKLYDFDFDFFRTDRLVCTEVAYRAFHGIGPLQFNLTQRLGRPTLSAEDLLDMAMDSRGFEPVAIFGAPACQEKMVEGSPVRSLLAESYRQQALD